VGPTLIVVSESERVGIPPKLGEFAKADGIDVTIKTVSNTAGIIVNAFLEVFIHFISVS